MKIKTSSKYCVCGLQIRGPKHNEGAQHIKRMRELLTGLRTSITLPTAKESSQ